MACGTRTTLEQAILSGWQQCSQCHFFIDPHCLNIIQNTMHGACPSFSQGVSRHAFQPTEIPSDQILIFVKDQYQQGRIGSLIDKLFYTKLPIIESASKSQTWKPETEALTREEIWQRFGLVLVRRAQGKWITWERISQL